MKIILSIVVLVFLIGAAFGDLSYWELRRLYNSHVLSAEYHERPLSSSSSSSSRRKRMIFQDWRYVHAGVVVTTDYNGETKWLIHKGNNYGDSSSTVITDHENMSNRWTRIACGSPKERSTVARFMIAGQVNVPYATFAILGANCQTAARKMWRLVNEETC